MDNKEELIKIQRQINNINDSLIRLNKNICDVSKNIYVQKINNTSWRGFICTSVFIILVSIFGVANKQIEKEEKMDKVLLYNSDNAVIFDKEDEALENMNFDNCSIIYIDEDSGISANDIAVSLVGEDGTVYYYNSETKEKTLINQK